ncbi:MAG: hypothetical protein POELPBGB_03586 [Bacteroidia bacterium]|nr:hypothetical protein [Bacteroidia bacterium]
MAKITIIGSGNVATHLAIAFLKAGHRILSVISRNEKYAAQIAEKTRSNYSSDFTSVPAETDFIILAVKDEAVAEIAAKLKAGNTIVAHTSGSVEMNVFQNHVANFGVFYPLQTFHKEKELEIKEVPFCIEGNNETSSNALAELAESISPNTHFVSSENRKVLHLAAVFACNFTNHFYAIAEKILADKNLSLDILRPLIKETALQVMTKSPSQLQTGPAIRGDEKIMQQHLHYLSTQPELAELYKKISSSIIKFKQ